MLSPSAFLAWTQRLQLSPEAIHEIIKLIASEQIKRVVVGLPLNMDDSLGPAAQKTIQWSRDLAVRAGIEILVDTCARTRARENGRKRYTTRERAESCLNITMARTRDFRLPISNTECEKDRELFYRDDSRSDAAIADSFSASFALDDPRENGIMNCFVMT